MWKLYISIPVIIIIITTLSYLVIGNQVFTVVVLFITIVGGVSSIFLAKKSFKRTPGMEDY
jgi:positive regulator of sigma E activity